MTQEEFDKAPLLDQILYDTTGMLVENHKDIASAMEKYHQAKVKKLGLFSVSQQRELLINFMQWHFDNDEFKNEPLADNIVGNYLKLINCG